MIDIACFGFSKAKTFITNISEFLFNATLANSYLSIKWIYLTMSKWSALIQDHYISFLGINQKFILLKNKKNIAKITFMPISVNKKVFSKDMIFSGLSSNKNPVETMQYFFNNKLSIF